MAHSPCFELACQTLESESSLERLEAPGTLRIALKGAGLDTGKVTPDQLSVVVEKRLPAELQARGIDNADAVCATLRQSLARMESAPSAGNSPEDVFARLGGG